MACIDMDSLAQYESEAKLGRADALYNLGLAYSTGQGVAQDYVVAHKWFNLAAQRGSDIAKNWRNQIDLLPVMPPFMRRVCSGYAPQWGVLQTRSV